MMFTFKNNSLEISLAEEPSASNDRYMFKERSVIDDVIYFLVMDKITNQYTLYRIPDAPIARMYKIDKVRTLTAAPMYIAKNIFGKKYLFDISNYKG